MATEGSRLSSLWELAVRDDLGDVIDQRLGRRSGIRIAALVVAGSYAVQECGDMIIESVSGDFSNVVGLPQSLVLEQLRSFGLQPESNPAS